jgi:hypothetical protein
MHFCIARQSLAINASSTGQVRFRKSARQAVDRSSNLAWGKGGRQVLEARLAMAMANALLSLLRPT